MNPSRIFIERPVATWLLMVAIFLSGIVAYYSLPLSALPEVDYPTIEVVTLYPGASPDVMTSSVTAPLETQFGQMLGLNQMSSTSSGSASVITLQFSLSLSLDVAEQEVQAAINAATTYLPTDLPTPPIYNKVNPADTPIVTLAITSKTLPLPKVEDLVDTRLAQKLSQVSGVGLVSISGGQRPAIRIQANPLALAIYGLDFENLRSVIVSANVNEAKGSFDGATRASTIDANDQISSAEEYKNVIVGYKNGAAIRLRDIADVVEGAENNKLGAWSNDTLAIILNIQRQPGANVIKTVDSIKKLLPKLKEALPSSLDVTLLTDRTTTIRASVNDVLFELCLSILLVVLVIFVFLRSVPATFIPSMAVPLSLVGTFGVMLLAGFSIDNLSLMALTIATGFVVDDAIVMIENISRYIEEGDDPMTAALKGSEQIGFTIISLTISLLAVLVPLLFMGDVVGRLFHEFTITLAVAILISAFVSLSFTPMLCARLLKPSQRHCEHSEAIQKEEKKGWIPAFAGMTSPDNLIAKYASMLKFVLQHQKATLIVAVGTLLLTILLYMFIPKGFFPVQDTGAIQVITQAPESVSYQEMASRQDGVAQEILKDKDVESLSSFIGVDGTNTTLNSGRMLVNLIPHDKRDNASDIIRRLSKKFAGDSAISVYMQPVQDLTIEDRVSRTQYQFSLEDANPKELSEWTGKLTDTLTKLPELADVANDVQDHGLSAFVEIDRVTAARLGVTAASIDNVLYDAFGQRLVSTIYTQANQYRVVLEAKPEFQLSEDALSKIYVASTLTPNKTVPLSAIATISKREAPLVINHLGQFPAATISFNLGKGYSLGDAVSAIRSAEKKLNMPTTIQTSFQGAVLAFQASLSNTLFLIFAAIVTMYIVLGVLYESYIHPVTILSTLPSAGIGALLALTIAGSDLGVIGIIGIILLIGIVKKNAIMMIDFALEAERERGLPPEEAIYEACLLRFRPILMTTMAALLGALPLMIGTGVGAELRHPLGIAMVGGLMVSQVLTLFTTPVIYIAFDKIAGRFAGRSAHARTAEANPAGLGGHH